MSLKILFKSKCKNIDICFGLLKIKRTVELENDIEVDNIQNNKVLRIFVISVLYIRL